MIAPEVLEGPWRMCARDGTRPSASGSPIRPSLRSCTAISGRGIMSTVAIEAHKPLEELVRRVAEAGRLRVDVCRATRLIHAAGSASFSRSSQARSRSATSPYRL